MSARHKLNTAAVLGALLVAGLAGALTGSSLVFALTAVVLIAGAIHDGTIRLRGRDK